MDLVRFEFAPHIFTGMYLIISYSSATIRYDMKQPAMFICEFLAAGEITIRISMSGIV